jgi:hypothetical protein
MKIVVATTFRDFKGTENDKIQYLFLENLKKQSFQNFTFAVTTFGEKNVARIVGDSLCEQSFIRETAVPAGSHFSLTDVLLTGMAAARGSKEPCIVVWCTCDVMLKEGFFQALVDHYRPGFAGIVHPNVLYHSVGDMNVGEGTLESLNDGIDLLFFDSEILEYARKEIEDYRFLDWGVFEWFLALIALRHAKERVNLLGVAKIGKIANDRKMTDESLQYFARCANMNREVLKRYIRDTGVLPNYKEAIGLKCHLRFKMEVAVPEYEEMIAKAKRERFCNWFFGKARGARCAVLRFFSNK